MKLIKPKVEILEQQPGILGLYKQIELAGRTCYRSEDKIITDSAKSFVDRMIKSGHGAMLEHGTVYLYCKATENSNPLDEYFHNKYSKAVWIGRGGYADVYITTNLRVLIENGWMDDLQYICEPTEYHEKRITVKWTCDRGVSHEFVRHRVFSFAMESTRYCNYSKDKFNNEITFIIPSWLDWKEETISKGDFEKSGSDSTDSQLFINSLLNAEDSYLRLIKEGWKPQQARNVLPNATKTELVMTGFESDWEGFFKLRSPKCGATGVYLDAAYLADKLYDQIKNKIK